LVHNLLYNVKNGSGSVCNCCACCCGMIIGAKDFNASFLMAKSDFTALIDQDECSACGTCAEERCPMEAIAETDGSYEVQAETCIGCGVCVIDCPTDAIKLKKRPESKQVDPPKNMVDWMRSRTTNRDLA